MLIGFLITFAIILMIVATVIVKERRDTNARKPIHVTCDTCKHVIDERDAFQVEKYNTPIKTEINYHHLPADFYSRPYFSAFTSYTSETPIYEKYFCPQHIPSFDAVDGSKYFKKYVEVTKTGKIIKEK